MRILISALSCNPALGSEALVGFKYAEALARRHEVVVLSSPPSQAPPGLGLTKAVIKRKFDEIIVFGNP